jgi:hypothetical protein
MHSLELIEQDRSLRTEADLLLDRHGVLDILRQYGTPHISGSYAMQLMTWRDLDIYLAMPQVTIDRFLELGQRLAVALSPRKASYTDHLNFPPTEGIPGLYWGIHTRQLNDGGWKIDLWGVTAEVAAKRIADCNRMCASMTEEMRRSVLAIKHVVCRNPRYRDTVTSQDVYDAVSVGGATTVDEFWLYKDKDVRPRGSAHW